MRTLPNLGRAVIVLLLLALVAVLSSSPALAGPSDTPGGPNDHPGRGPNDHPGGGGKPGDHGGDRGKGAGSPGVCTPDPALMEATNTHLFALTADDLEKTFYGDPGNDDDGSFADQGFSPIRITGFTAGKDVLFATRWADVQYPDWSTRHDMTADEFEARFQAMKGTHRMIDVGAYTLTDGEVRYTDIWVQGDGLPWFVFRDVKPASMEAIKLEMKNKGMVPLRVEGYHLDGELHFISLWAKGDCKWEMHERATQSQYEARVGASLNNLRLAHTDSYIQDGRQMYGSIWYSQPPGATQREHHDRHWYLLQRDSNANLCGGYVLDNLYASEGSPFPYYGTVWTFHDDPGIDEESPYVDRLRKHTECADGRAGLKVYNFTDNAGVSLYSHLPYGTSSTIKVPILYSLLRKADAEGFSILETTIPNGVPYGANNGDWLDEDDPTVQYTLDTLIRAMIDSSNNWATNRLIDFLATDTMSGFDVVNADMEALGLSNTRLTRYMTGDGAPTNHGTTGPVGDYTAGFDNSTTPDDMVGLMIAVHGAAGGEPLSDARRDYFWEILDLNGGNDFAGYLSEGVSDEWGDLADVASKGGSNTWTGDVGDFAAKPQLGDHYQRSAVGRILFEDGTVVFFAGYIDEADSELAGTDFLGCAGMEVFRHYTGETTGVTPLACQ